MSEHPLVSADEMASVLAEHGDARTDTAPAPVAGPSAGQFTLRRPLVIAADRELAARGRVAALAHRLGTALGDALQAEIELEVHGFQQQQVRTAIERLPGPAWILDFQLADGGGLALGLDPPTALALVELTLGGAGSYAADSRLPTPLEIRVISNLARVLAGPLEAELGQTLTPAFRVGSVSTRLAPPGEVVGAGLLRLRIGGGERNGLLLVTSQLLREPREAVPPGAAADGPASPITDRLLELSLEARPVLGVGRTTLRKLTALGPGTLVQFDTPETAALELRINGQPLFSGSVGRTPGGAQFKVARLIGSEEGS